MLKVIFDDKQKMVQANGNVKELTTDLFYVAHVIFKKLPDDVRRDAEVIYTAGLLDGLIFDMTPGQAEEIINDARELAKSKQKVDKQLGDLLKDVPKDVILKALDILKGEFENDAE